MPNAIVTGASQGIGKAIAEKLLSSGFNIAICARNQSKLTALQAEWKAKYPGSKVIAMAGDLSLTEDIAEFADLALATFPRIDLLVNNAGAYQPGLLADEEEGLLEKMIGINLYSAYHLTRKILPLMKHQQSGHIFNMCSVASLKAYPNGGSYSISKYALLGFTENLRHELMTENIKVTAICPGATWSPSWEGSGVDEQRIMGTNDIADALWSAFSLSPRANVDTIILRPVKGDL
jgi:short-subunit dehydrogenase